MGVFYFFRFDLCKKNLKEVFDCMVWFYEDMINVLIWLMLVELKVVELDSVVEVISIEE